MPGRIGAADLPLVLAIARHRNFRKAAFELGVTPSALSHALRALEERIEVRLFNRTTRSVAPTQACAQLFARVGPAFQEIEAAVDELNAFRGAPAGTLRLNASHTAARHVLLPLVTRFLERHPGIAVEIVADNALVDTVSAGFDAGVRLGETLAADMVAVPIGPSQRTAVVASPAYFEQRPRPATPHELQGLPCIRFRFDSGREYLWEFERDGQELRIAVDGPLALNEPALMIDAALAGVGLAYVFESMVEAELASGRLVRVLAEWCAPYPGFFLYYPSRRQVPSALRAFVEFARAEAEERVPVAAASGRRARPKVVRRRRVSR